MQREARICEVSVALRDVCRKGMSVEKAYSYCCHSVTMYGDICGHSTSLWAARTSLMPPGNGESK